MTLTLKNTKIHMQQEKDNVIPHVREGTEEGKKVARNKGQKYLAVHRRVK